MTDDGRRLGYQPDINYQIQRELEAQRGSEQAINKADETVLPQMVEELNRKINGVLGKIDQLQKELKRTVQNTVPVAKHAYEVRTALRNLFPGSSEDFITFNQFIEGMQYAYKRSNIPTDVVINTVTGNDEVDSRILDQLSWGASDDMAPEDLAVIAGQFLLVKLAARISQPYTSQSAADVAAPKLYPGTERGPATAQILIGLAALLLQIADNRDAVVSAIKQNIDDFSLVGQDAESVVKQAEAQDKDPSIENWKIGKRPYWWDVIVRYVYDYIANSELPGYEEWLSYEILEDRKSSLRQSESEFDKYGRTVDESVQSAWQMSLDMYRMMLYQATDSNDQVNKLATILSSPMVGHLLCCLVMFVGSLPTQQLKLLRYSVALQANGLSFDLGAGLQTARSKADTFLAERVLEPILHEVDRFFNKYTEEALKLVDQDSWADDELFDIIRACTPVDQLIEYGLRGLERLKLKLRELLMRAWERIELKSVQGGCSIRIMADSKRCKQLLSVVDAIINGIERGNLCAQEGGNMPTVEETEDFVNRVIGDLAPGMSLPAGGDPYETFSFEPFKSAAGLQVPDPGAEPSGGQDDTEAGRKRFRVEDCLRRSPDPRQVLKALGLTAQLDKDLRDARNVDASRPAT